MILKWGRHGRAISLVLVMFWVGRAVAVNKAIEIPEIQNLFTDDPDLPGRELVFTNLMKRLKLDDVLHAPVSPMMEATYEYLSKVAFENQKKLHRDCREALERRTPEFDEMFNLSIAKYLEHRGVEVETHAVKYLDEKGEVDHVDFRTHIPPSGTGKSWHSRLARYLSEFPEPVKLFVYPRLFTGSRLAVEFSMTSEGLAVGLSPLSILPYSISLTLEHELFHNLQTQTRLAGAPGAWPDHVIKSKNPKLFHGKAREYLADYGCFSIEEIGAAARDAVQNAVAVKDGQMYRLAEDMDLPPLYLVERDRRVGLSFAKGAARVYRRALEKLEAGELKRDDVRSIPEDGACEIRIDESTSLAMPRFKIDDTWADHVRTESGRALTWIAAYRRFLVRPRKH